MAHQISAKQMFAVGMKHHRAHIQFVPFQFRHGFAIGCVSNFHNAIIAAAVQNAKSGVATKNNWLLCTSIGLLMSTDIHWGCEWLNRSIENPTELPWLHF
jgi:hypothetical protein